MMTGGSESTISPVSRGFTACKALSTNYNNDPVSASRPFDDSRDGFTSRGLTLWRKWNMQLIEERK